MTPEPLGALVTFQSRSGLTLDGIWFKATDAAPTIIHVHGSFGNFYANSFVRVMADVYTAAALNFLTFNTSGHDGIAEGSRKDAFEYVGGAVSLFQECVTDIGGALDFVRSRAAGPVVLQGHSLGCDRVLSFLLEEHVDLDVALLAPCDSYTLQQNWRAPETVEEQIARLNSMGAQESLLPIDEYGIRQGEGWDYHIPVSKKTLLSIMEGNPFRLIRYDRPQPFILMGRCFVYIGGRDRLQTVASDVAKGYFGHRCQGLSWCYVADGDHMLTGCERQVATQIAAWARARPVTHAPVSETQ